MTLAWYLGFHIEILWLKLKLNHLAYGTVAVGRELVLGDNGLSKWKCTTDHYEGFAPELHQTFEKEQVARFPLLPYFNTFWKKSFSAVYTCETIPIGISLSEMSKFTFWGEKHVAPFRVGLIFGIWCKLLPQRLIPLPFVLWQGPLSLNTPPPPVSHVCDWTHCEAQSWVNEEAIMEGWG